MKLLAALLPILSLGLASAAPAADRAIPLRGEPVVDNLPLGNLPGGPFANLPVGTRSISSFGERPVFSPNGQKIAFIGASYGDAFEYDLATGAVRNLTSHMPHKGFLRVHYLRDGSYLLLGPHTPDKTREETRASTIELWWMDAKASQPAVRLGPIVYEGLATSRISNMIAWSELTPRAKRSQDANGTAMKTATVVVTRGRPRLDNVRTMMETGRDCMVEAQDFLPGDRGLTFPCYRFTAKPGESITRVMSVDFASGEKTTYPTPPQLYGEVEGLFPDGKRTLVECSGDRTAGMDLCLLELKTDRPAYTRITRIMDYGHWKYGNPTVSPDGRRITASIGSADVVDAGVGEGIVVIDLPAGF